MHFLVNAPMQDAALALGSWRSHDSVDLLPDHNFSKCIVTIRGGEDVVGTILVLLMEAGVTVRELSHI